MEKYTAPEIQIIVFEAEDVITASRTLKDDVFPSKEDVVGS